MRYALRRSYLLLLTATTLLSLAASLRYDLVGISLGFIHHFNFIFGCFNHIDKRRSYLSRRLRFSNVH